MLGDRQSATVGGKRNTKHLANEEPNERVVRDEKRAAPRMMEDVFRCVTQSLHCGCGMLTAREVMGHGVALEGRRGLRVCRAKLAQGEALGEPEIELPETLVHGWSECRSAADDLSGSSRPQGRRRQDR